MRLICPECNAQYDIDDAMIPDEGREVECSACGHVWMQSPVTPLQGDQNVPEQDAAPVGDPAETATGSPSIRGLSGDLRAAAKQQQDVPAELGEAPVLQRPLPDEVLSILREETARELGARKQIRGESVKPANAQPSAPVRLPDSQTPSRQDATDRPRQPVIEPAEESSPDWPATTVTQPDLDPLGDSRPAAEAGLPASHEQTKPEPESPDPAIAPSPEKQVSPVAPVVVPSSTDNRQPVKPPLPRRRVPPGLPNADELAATLQTDQASLAVAATASAEPAPQRSAPSGYRTGLVRALSVAAALLIAYVAGSAWVGSGAAPEAVVAVIGGIDSLRSGLQDTFGSIIGRGAE